MTVAIPVRNEARELPKILSRLARFAEVVVLDGGSTDGTADVARGDGARVLQFTWDGALLEEAELVSPRAPVRDPLGAFPRRGRVG